MNIKKRLFSFVTAMSALIFAVPLLGADSSENTYNSALDIDSNGKVSTRDALLIMQYVAKNIEFTDEQIAKADINGDDVVNSTDALTLMRIINADEVYIEKESSSQIPSESESESQSESESESSSSSTSSSSSSSASSSSTSVSSSSSGSIQIPDDDFFANGIDVSKWQGDSINWKSVKNAGYEFAILRAGYGRYENQKDACFETNYANAKAAGLDVGAYHFSYARTVAEAKIEAQVCLEWLDGKEFEYPIFYDVESQTDLGAELTSDIIDAFCTELENAGYYVGVYSYAYYLNNYIEKATLEKYPVWVAHFDVAKPNFTGHDMWQYTDTGTVSGISGSVDLNYCYTDFKTYIKSNKLNGF